MKKIRLVFSALMLTGLLSSCSLFDRFIDNDDEEKETTSQNESGTTTDTTSGGGYALKGIHLNKNTLSLEGGDSETLTVTFDPSTWTNKNVKWETSDPSVATVSKGTVIGVSMGECDITVKYAREESIFDTCHVTVTSDYQCKNKTTINQTYTEFSTKGYSGSYDEICPTKGNVKLLVLPIWFTDSDTYLTNSTYKANVREDIGKAYLGTNVETGWRSVKTFYEEESQGAVTITGTVADWYECGLSSSYMAADGNSAVRTKQLVTDATQAYFTAHSSDSRKNYDSDNDGYIDGVMLIYGAPDYASKGIHDGIPYDSIEENNLWAYKFATGNSRNGENPSANIFFWASYDFMYGSAQSVSRTGLDYHGGDTSNCTIDTHTYIHEMGHVFGLDDYYDYGSHGYTPAGQFSMQDENVGAHDAFSVMAYGWANPYIPLKSCTITISDFQSSHDMVLLTPEWNGYDSAFDEYLLLELFTPTGLNKFDCDNKYSSRVQGPNEVGIRLWHVDARLYSYSKSRITSNVNDGYVYLYNSNTYDGGREGNEPENNLLQLIHNNTTLGHKNQTALSNESLFQQGDSFTINTYKKQFVNGSVGNLNNGTAFKWSFTVDAMTETSATISFVLSA